MKNNYSVYQHVTPDGMYYFGQTNNIKRRWSRNGAEYKTTSLYPYIEKYGWDNIQHIILFENQSKEDALKIEDSLIISGWEKGNCINQQRSGNVSKEGGYFQQYYEQNKEQISEQKKQYYEQNKDKIKQYYEQNKDKIREYQEQNKDKINEQKRKYYERNKEKFKEYREQNKEQIREYQRQYQREYKEQNKDKIREYNREYQRKNRQRKKLEKQLKEVQTTLF